MDLKEQTEEFFPHYALAHKESTSRRSGEDLGRLMDMSQSHGRSRLPDVATSLGRIVFARTPCVRVEAVVGSDLTPAMAREFWPWAPSLFRSLFVINDAEKGRARIEAARLRVRALEVVAELLPWERGWAPVPPDGLAASQARAFATTGGPEAKELLFRCPSHPMPLHIPARSESGCAAW